MKLELLLPQVIENCSRVGYNNIVGRGRKSILLQYSLYNCVQWSHDAIPILVLVGQFFDLQSSGVYLGCFLGFWNLGLKIEKVVRWISRKMWTQVKKAPNFFCEFLTITLSTFFIESTSSAMPSKKPYKLEYISEL